MTNKAQSVSDSPSFTDSITGESIAGGNVSLGVSDNISVSDSVLPYPIVSGSTPSALLVRSIREVYASDGSVSSRKIIGTTISAKITKDSDRTVDTAQFVFPMQNAIAQNDGILYVQDIVDTTFLRGIWNFHYSMKDESGNALDGTSPNEVSPIYGNSMLYGNAPFHSMGTDNFNNVILRDFHVSGDEITITDANDLIDLSGQFDIHFWGSWRTSIDSNNNPKYILDKLGVNGSAQTQGMSIYLSAAASAVMTVDLYSGGILTNITGSKVLNDEKFHFIRIVRDGSNNIKLYVDGVQDGSTVSSSASFMPTHASASLKIGNKQTPDATHIMNGTLLQLRIYCGGVLSTSDATTVYAYQPQPYTMKFGGIVYKIENGTDSKTVYCKSFAKQFGDIQLSYNSLISTSPGTPPVSPYIFHNVYVGQKTNDIIANFVSNVLSGWTFVFVPDPTMSPQNNVITKYVANGSLISNIFYLLYMASANLTFFSTARKTIIVETINQDRSTAPSAITFTGVQAGGRYSITDDGKDDTAYINEVQVTGGLSIAGAHETFTTSDANKAVTLTHQPISATVQQPNGTYLVLDTSGGGLSPAAGKFSIDTENSRIIFGTAFGPGGTCTVDYQYYDTSNLYWANSDSTGITMNGRYTKKYNIPQMKDLLSMRLFSANVKDRFGNTVNGSVIPRRVTIDAPNLVNNIRENFKVNVVQGVKGINGTFTVKQIIWSYPDAKTTIVVGDFIYDFFDINSGAANNIDQNTQAYTSVKNVSNS